MKKNILYHLLIVLFVTTLKIIYKYSSTEDLRFLLEPVSKCISIVYGTPYTYNSQNGYYFEELSILINKSCSGFNFWLLSFSLLTFTTFQFLHRVQERIYAFFSLFFSTLFLTLIVNTSRILLSILVTNIIHRYNITVSWLHEAIGAFVYLFFFVITYFLFSYHFLNKKLKKDEK